MRARNIKPGFFINCELSEIDFASRLLFIGLWCYADREGRFEWKPKQIKAAIFPYDDVKIEKLLCNLMSLHFITRHDNTGYVENFKSHQNPHPHEAKSKLPQKPEQTQCHDKSVTLHGMSCECNADIIIPDIIIPDTSKDSVEKTRNARFIPPPIEDVKAYCLERGNSVDPQKWFDHYSSNGWKVGKNKMVDWKAAVRTWEGKENAGSTKRIGNKQQHIQAGRPAHVDFDRSSEW